MKTYKSLIGEALIKVGIGALGGSAIALLKLEQNYWLLAATAALGISLIHFGAWLAKDTKQEKKE